MGNIKTVVSIQPCYGCVGLGYHMKTMAVLHTYCVTYRFSCNCLSAVCSWSTFIQRHSIVNHCLFSACLKIYQIHRKKMLTLTCNSKS